MPEQITIEQMQTIIGRLTLNYELQLSAMQKQAQELGQRLQALESKVEKRAELQTVPKSKT